MFPGAIDVPSATYLDQLGTIFARFTTQDSGNFSYGVGTADARYFVKTAGDPADTRPYLDFDGRVASSGPRPSWRDRSRITRCRCCTP